MGSRTHDAPGTGAGARAGGGGRWKRRGRSYKTNMEGFPFYDAREVNAHNGR